MTAAEQEEGVGSRWLGAELFGQGLEDGSILITMFDAERAGEALFMFYKDDVSMVDEEVKKIIDGLVPDITEEFCAIDENIAWEDR